MNVYLVGGAVRDKLLDRPIKERDYVVVGSTPNELMSLGYQQVGSDFPVFLHPQTHDEYALARTERKSGQGYTGFICDFTPDVTLEEDLIRRDLTVNAMAEDKEGTIIDPFNGQQDLHNKVLRHVSDAFSEDPVRILRVARFAARYHHLGFSIAPETLMLMKTMVAQGEINTLTKERVWLEIEKSLDDDAMHIFTDVLQQVDALTRLLPTLASYWSSEHSLTLAKHIKHVSQKNKRLIVFSLWLRNLSLIDVASLEEYLRIPNRYLDAVKNFVTFEAELSTGQPSVEGILELLSKTDSDRRPERLSLFLDTFSVLGNDQKVLADTLRNIAIQIRDIDVGSIIQMGFKGIEIKHQIELNKVRIIRAALSL